MSGQDLAGILLAALDDDALAELAERLRPFLADAEGDPGRLLAPREAAARLGLHERTVARMAREGRLPGAVKVGRGWKVPRRLPGRQAARTAPRRGSCATAAGRAGRPRLSACDPRRWRVGCAPTTQAPPRRCRGRGHGPGESAP